MRYDKRVVFENGEEEFKDLLTGRSRSFFVQYDTPQFKFPTDRELAELDIIYEVWKRGDRFFKFAHKHYGDPNLWWVIAWYNLKPTESHFKIGDIVSIPVPLERILRNLGV
jgi:hypothetical protein